MAKQIGVLGSFDTKGEELTFLGDQIRQCACYPLRIDTSLGGASLVPTDISSQEVAAAAGEDIARIRASKDTHVATEKMIVGASRLVCRLHDEGRLDAVVALGGASNTGLATQVMGSLPFGVPKLMVSSMAAVPAYAGAYFGTKDIAMLHSVVDIAGLNPLLENLLIRAAGAICGMAQAGVGALTLAAGQRSKPRVAMSEFKFSETCCRHASRLLSDAGVEVIAFHAQGIGDRALEEVVAAGLVDGVLDVVPGGVAEELLGGNRAAGPGRLEAAGSQGIPQVVTPCGFDMLSCGPLERGDRGDPLWVSRQLSKRKLFVPDALRVQARTSAEELLQVAAVVAEKLNRSKGATRVLIPSRGWSSLSEEGMPLWDPEADRAFTGRLRERLSANVSVTGVDLCLNSTAFAEVAVAELLAAMGLPCPGPARAA